MKNDDPKSNQLKAHDYLYQEFLDLHLQNTGLGQSGGGHWEKKLWNSKEKKFD